MNTGANAMTQKYKLAPIEALDKVAFRLDDMNSLSDKEEIQQDKDCIETIRAALTAQSETGDVFYDQTVQGEKGNCMSACLASLMGIHIDNVPNFFDLSDNNDDWWIELRKWLAGYNLGILTINFHPDYLDRFKGKFIISGESQRGLFHATIWENGKMIHDPHPSKSGIKDPQQVDILYQLNPRTSTCKKCLQVDALMNKAVDRMQSLVPDEISVIGVLVGLRDFSNRPDYCPKVMKAKLSECIDNLQKLYHEPVEKVEGLAEALEYWEREDCIANTLDAKAIYKAARLWLRKQGRT